MQPRLKFENQAGPGEPIRASRLPQSWINVRKTLRPKLGLVYRDLLMGYACLFLGAVYCAKWATPWTTSVGAAWFGFWFHYLFLFLHEAAHYNLHLDRVVNDRIANLFIGSLFFQDISSYRQVHWAHHQNHGTTKDTENTYFNALTPGFLIRCFFMYHAFKSVMNRRKYTRARSASSEKSGQFFSMIFTHGAVWGLGFYFHALLFVVSWYAGLFLFFPLISSLRQVLEHRDPEASKRTDFYLVNHGARTYTFDPSLFAKFFGAAGFYRHLLHHWDPSVSYTLFDEMEEVVSKEQLGNELNKSRTSYFRRLFQHIKCGLLS